MGPSPARLLAVAPHCPSVATYLLTLAFKPFLICPCHLLRPQQMLILGQALRTVMTIDTSLHGPLQAVKECRVTQRCLDEGVQVGTHTGAQVINDGALTLSGSV